MVKLKKMILANDITRNLTIARLLMSLDDRHMAMIIYLVAFYQAPSNKEGYNVCLQVTHPTMKCRKEGYKSGPGTRVGPLMKIRFFHLSQFFFQCDNDLITVSYTHLTLPTNREV